MLTGWHLSGFTMKTLVTLVFLVFTVLAIPVQGGQFLTEAQKELLLEKSRALGLVTENEHTQNAGPQREKTNIVKNRSKTVKSSQSGPIYLGYINHSTRPKTQSLQSIFINADWGTPTSSNRPVKESQQFVNTATSHRPVTRSRQVTNSISNRPVKQEHRLATTANGISYDKQSRQITRSARKAKWSNFFKNVLLVASEIGRGMSQTNSQFTPYIPQLNTPYIPQPDYFTPLRTNHIIHTMSIGNQNINVGGSHELRTWNVGNQTFGTFDGMDVKMHNFGNFSHGTIGGQKARCWQAGELTFCK